MTELRRRTLLTAGLGAGVALAAPSSATGLVVSGRPRLTHGVMSGDVTTNSGVVWARSDVPGRLVATVRSGRHVRVVRGGWATPDTDHTAKILLRGLRPGADHTVDLHFEGRHGHAGERGRLHLVTGDPRRGATSFVWSGDTAGQGWGINPDLGGMIGYRAMHATNPDFFIHSGDTIYADGPIKESVAEPDGQVWRNIIIPEVTEVAQTLQQFRGRHRYNMMDSNVRAMYADVPVIAQWDDHETVNNWYPGEVLDDPRYTQEKRVDVLAGRAKQAWREWQPIADSDTTGRRGRDGRNRIYRTVPRGRHLDVFNLDMRTYKSPNTSNIESGGTEILGREQREWLINELCRSRATWKVIAADLPIGLVVPDGSAQESVSNADPGRPLGREREIAWLLRQIKRHCIRNVVWLTADVHYCAAHHYAPERAAFTDFDPFWEFVAGPISAGGFGPNALDATFGPRVDFQKFGTTNQSPRAGNAHYFGHVDIADDGVMTVSLRTIRGEVLYTKRLEPQER